MTRFGRKLNYVINTFVKHTPVLSISVISALNCALSAPKILRLQPQTPLEKQHYLCHFVTMHKNMAEKADYLQIGGSNINNKNKGLCLGAGVLAIGGRGHKHFCHKSRGGGGRNFFPARLGES